jgi:uncharacterized membrane protein SpoIIM required for sporulation
MMAMQTDQKRPRWEELTRLLNRLDQKGIHALTVDELKQVGRLYRHVTIDLSKARADGDDPELVQYLNYLAGRAHGHVYRTKPVNIRFLLAFVVQAFPRLVRKRALPVLIATAALVLTTLASCLAVIRDPELAYSLFDENMVEYENVRLERREGEYRGNFTFDVSESPLVAVAIIGNNIKVAVLIFALGALCCLPGLLVIIYNGRMVGTLTGMMWNHGFLLPFYSLILTHGVLELSAFCIAGGGSLMMGWALISPGRRTRREALRKAAGEAFGLLAGAALLLVVAGTIEAYITPHFPQAVRWSVAAISALFLGAYIGLVGREAQVSEQSAKSDFQIAVNERGRDSGGLGVQNMGAHLPQALEDLPALPQ